MPSGLAPLPDRALAAAQSRPWSLGVHLLLTRLDDRSRLGLDVEQLLVADHLRRGCHPLLVPPLRRSCAGPVRRASQWPALGGYCRSTRRCRHPAPIQTTAQGGPRGRCALRRTGAYRTGPTSQPLAAAGFRPAGTYRSAPPSCPTTWRTATPRRTGSTDVRPAALQRSRHAGSARRHPATWPASRRPAALTTRQRR